MKSITRMSRGGKVKKSVAKCEKALNEFYDEFGLAFFEIVLRHVSDLAEDAVEDLEEKEDEDGLKKDEENLLKKLEEFENKLLELYPNAMEISKLERKIR